jgi:hypothetical protein
MDITRSMSDEAWLQIKTELLSRYKGIR